MPCLIHTYQAIKESGKSFEIILISTDHNEDSFEDSREECPWLSIPYDDRRRSKIHRIFESEGEDYFLKADTIGVYRYMRGHMHVHIRNC